MTPAAPVSVGTVAVTVCSNGTGGYEFDAVAAAVRAALDHLGGLARFVHPGQTVLLKPNLFSARAPDEAVTTHPSLVRALVRLCRECGAARVWIGDSPAGHHEEEQLWAITGMAEVAAQESAELKSFTGEIVPTACGPTFLPVPAWFREVDVFISVPKLKTHLLTTLTCAMKNVFGMVAGQAKAMCHRRFSSPQAMSSFLVDVYSALRPHLTVVDAIVALEGQGPANGNPRPLGLVLASADGVAADMVCARLLGLNFTQVPMLRCAVAQRVGATPGELRTVGDGVPVLSRARLRPSSARYLQAIPEPLFHWVIRFVSCRPRFDYDICNGCGICMGTCPQKAIPRDPDSRRPGKISAGLCILCMCCVESCPRHAISVRSPLDFWNALRDGLKIGPRKGPGKKGMGGGEGTCQGRGR